MPDFSLTDLWNLAESAAKNVRDDYQLYDLAIVVDPPRITAGIVSAVVRALETDHVIYRKPTPKPATPESVLAVNGRGGIVLTDSLAPADTAMTGANETAEPPRRNSIEAESPATKAAEAAAPDGWTPEQRAAYIAAAPLIKRLARDGYMPTMAEFDAAERSDLATAQALCFRLGIKWSDLAARLGLELRPRGHRFQGKRAEKDSAPEGVAPLAATKPHSIGETKRPARLPTPPVEPKPTNSAILHRAPDGGVTRILKNADGRHVHALRTYEGE